MKTRTLKLSILLIFIFVWGCATVDKKVLRKEEEPYFIEAGQFCKRHNLKLKYFPFYEELVLSGDFIEIILRQDLDFVLINGNVKSLGRSTTYDRGKFFIPASLEPFLKSFKRKVPKDLASLISVKIETIVIDPGHGGRDPGAISPWGLREKDVNLKIAKFLYEQLKSKGFKVYLTRDRDVFVSLKDRVDFARRKKADLFISVHANANRSRRLKGFEVYYLSPKFCDTQSKVLATAENLCQTEGLKLPAKLKNIVGEMLNRENKRETAELVSSIMRSADNVGIYTRKSIGAPFYVLKYNVCPAVLVEVGYLTNYKEERLLRTRLYKKQLALAIAEGVVRLRDSLGKQVALQK
ncbi:MAG: N-acetylmuramoyl-L-alanine amidase [Candidatus Omnitrophica bacterium]|nr:N-acetylmuramoyl-L-alanine amidase [Candidatus Omnitrophota bacterium]